MVVAFTKSEKVSNEMIKKEIENSGWKAWIPGMIKFNLWG